MLIGIYKGNSVVKVHESGNEFIIEFENGTSITVKDLENVELAA